MKPIIEVKHIYKKYQIREKLPYYSLRDSITNILKPSQKSNFDKKNEFWALRDISFNVMPGEVIGIIGRNGAGKSTLLKILSKITNPTKGEIILRGRVASLLEVGTGFHPELTGRENIFLNGAILGMKRIEIKKKFDEIVDFAEIEKFLDTPVKHYSSGMYMRLAFAVAAHLEPEILLVDEVLAVGDAKFQKKCLGKMNEVAKQGRTVLFVSHNIIAISQLCKILIYLEDGKLKKIDNKEVILPLYFGNSRTKYKDIKIKSYYEGKNESWKINTKLVIEIFWVKDYFKPGWEVDVAGYNLEGNKLFAIESQKLKNFSTRDSLCKGIKFYITNPGLAASEVRIDVGIRQVKNESYKILIDNAFTITPSIHDLPSYSRDDVIILPKVEYELINYD